MSSKHRGHYRSYPGCVGGVSFLAAPVERRRGLASSLGRVKGRQASTCLAISARKRQQLNGEKYVHQDTHGWSLAAQKEVVPEPPGVSSARNRPTETGRLDPIVQVFHFSCCMQRRAKADVRIFIALTRRSSSQYARMNGKKPAKMRLSFGLGRYVHAA